MDTEKEKNAEITPNEDGALMIDGDAPAESAPKKKKAAVIPFIREKVVGSRYFYLLGAFFLPVIIMLGAHAAASFFPFGNMSILSLDFQAQYVYYFEQTRRLLTEGGSWFYTWSRTLGGEFIGYVSYYMGSPFNLIVALFPEKHIAMAASAVILTKIGAMGTTMGLYLHKTRGTRDLKTLIFSTMYALCGYVAIQQYNPMWLDAIIWLPLLVLGIEKLVKEKKIILYIVSLALILTANYYIGYMCCIFTAMYFFYYYALVRPEIKPLYQNNKSGIGKFFSLCGTRTFFRMAGATVVGLLLSAFMLIGAYYSLGFGKVGFSNPDFSFKLRFDFLDIFVKMLPGSHDTVRENGLPVIYSGLLSLLLIPLFYISKKITPRKKLLTSILLGALLFSFIINPIDLAWHGFSAPNWLNYRYSFLFSFVVICMACDAFQNLSEIKFGKFAVSSVSVLFVIFMIQKFGYEFKLYNRTLELDDIQCIGMSVVLLFIYLGLMYLVFKGKEKGKSAAVLALAVIVSVELFANSIISIDRFEGDTGTVRYNNYSASKTSTVERFDSYTGSVARLKEITKLIKENDSSFYRTEATIYRQRGGVNEQMAAGYYGISSSTSTLNKDIIRFMAKIGYASNSHWTKYLGGTPISDALLGIKYVIGSDRPTEGNGGEITRNNYHSFDPNFYIKSYEIDEPTQIGPSEYKIYAMQNTKALPIAYGVSSAIRDFEDVYSMDKYYAAPDLLNRMIKTMLSETVPDISVFKPLKMKYTSDNASVSSTSITFNWDRESHTTEYFVVNSNGDGASITFNLTAVDDGVVYMHMPSVNFGKTAKVYVNDKFLTDYFGEENVCTMEIGTFKAGDVINVRVQLNDDKLYISHSSSSLFWYVDYKAATEAFDYLDAASIYVEDYGNSFIKGTIDLPAGQTTVFTSIPYDAGWNVYVDGKQVETYMVFDALLAFDSTEGFHEIELRYFPKLYKIGIALTAIGFVLLAVIIVWNVNGKFRDKVKKALHIGKKQNSDEAENENADNGAPPSDDDQPTEKETQDAKVTE